MKKGEIINGYKILQDFSTAGGGLCKWTFAEKKGVEYFFKEFLSPKFPLPESPGSEKLKNERKIDCEKFEKHHFSLMKKLNEKSIIGGNLIITLDFFRDKTTYYKVTEKIDVTSLSIYEISNLTCEIKLLILKTISNSLKILHKEKIVHGDLKPDNILIKQTSTGFFAAKLIDFDNSYISGLPPELSDDVVGDMAYYSPELAKYIMNDNTILSNDLTVKSDVFALGLLFHIYWTGKLPEFDNSKFKFISDFVNNTENFKVNYGVIPDDLVDLINKMITKDYNYRPNMEEVFTILQKIDCKKVSLNNLEMNKSKLKGKLFAQIEKSNTKSKK